MQPKTLLRISRPRFWIYLLGPFLIGVAANGLNQPLLPILIYGLYFTVPANLLIYGVNDIFDYQTDILNEKKQGYETLVRPNDRRALWTAIAITNLPFLVPFLLTGTFQPYGCITFLGFLFFGIFYSAPPIRAKAIPFLDSIFNVLYFLPGLFGYLLQSSVSSIDVSLLIAASFWCMAMHAYSAVPDIRADRGANLQTIATALGRERTLWFCAILYGAAAILCIHVLGWLAYLLGSIYVGLMACSMYAQSDEKLFRFYTWFPRLNSLAGFALCLFALTYRF